LGGGADDRLEGDEGVDQALFSDIFNNYTFTITDPTNPAFEFEHSGGTMADGTDTTQDIEFGVFEFVDANNDGNDDDGNQFFVPLLVDPDDDSTLKDGPEITPDEDILDPDGNTIGTITVASPAWTFDGSVNYTLTLGSEQSILNNFAYVIDVSGSTAGEPIAQAQAAYQALTEALIDSGIADNSIFAIVPFNSDASVIGPLSATEAISTVNGLTAGGGTEFGPALLAAQSFFNSTNNNATNIAYFLSDGFGNGASELLQNVAEVRAFGIGDADLAALNIIDSDSAVLLSDPADLFTEFNEAIVEQDTIERIDVSLNGTVIETILPDQLTESTLGLQFEGTIDNLEVSRTAQNDIVFEVVFNNETPTASLEYFITTGQNQITQQTNNGTQEVTIFSVNESDFTPTSLTSQLIGREIIANDLDNTITVEDGENTLFGNGGSDRFILLGGINLIDGSEGVDTVEIDLTQAEAGEISQTGNLTNIGTETTLLNVEFIEFSDVRLSTDTLAVTPILSLAENGLSVTEGDPNTNLATFTINLSSVATEDVVIDFNTQSDIASEGTDFVEATGQLTIAAGDSSGEITIEVLDDTDTEDEELVLLNLTAVSGATFADGSLTETAGLNIIDDDSISTIDLQLIGFSNVVEGNPDTPSTGLALTFERLGDLSDSDTIEVQIVAAGDNPAQASDFINGFSTSQLTFAPGESTQTIEVPIAADLDIEANETFGIQLTSISGLTSVNTEVSLFTILDDDATEAPIPIISDISDQDNNNTLVLDQGGTFQFTITDNQNSVDFSQQLVILTENLQLPIISTLGNASGLPGTFSTNDLSADATLATAGSFQFGIQAPNSTEIMLLDLDNVTEDGFTLSGNGLEIAVTIPETMADSPLLTRTAIADENAIGVELTDGTNNFTNAEISIDATLHREAAFENTIGFYLVDAANEGSVIDPLTGQAIVDSESSNRIGHLQAAINNSLFNSTAPANNQTLDISETIGISNLEVDVQLLLVPYIIADGDIEDLSADLNNVYSTFLGTNADGAEHIRLLSNNALGFEDIAGGGDNDFDDIVLQLNAVDVNIL
jgi:hypothetical protein